MPMAGQMRRFSRSLIHSAADLPALSVRYSTTRWISS